MHNHIKKLIKMREEGKIPCEPGKVYKATAAHDDWCKIHEGGECNCDPDITQIEIPDERNN